MSKIIRLPQNLINKIAAGEVVERPASVIKELIENSIDAEASKITINIENAGKKLIEVIDNGTGMSKEDAEIAFEHHSTSKIKNLDDLENITTMGFRGEALSSIGAVSKVTLTTKNNKDVTGTQIKIQNEKTTTIEEAGIGQGTDLKVEELFFNIPARLKFLKSDTTELKYIIQTFINLALSNSQIHFILSHNKKNLYNLPNVQNLKNRIFDLFGQNIADNLISIIYDSPILKINGFVGHPSIAKVQRNHQYVFLNKRPIQDALIAKAVYDGFESTIPRDRFPVLFIFIKIDPKEVDVNVHPRKTQVKFRNTNQIYLAVKNAVKTSLFKQLQSNVNKIPPFKQSYKIKESFVNGRLSDSKIDYKSYPKDKKDLVKQSLLFSAQLLSGSNDNTSIVEKDTKIYKQPYQIFNNYLLYEYGEKLWIIDQHAAAERVSYEKLSSQYKKENIEGQKLLIPQTIELKYHDSIVLKSNIDQLSKVGIYVEEFGSNIFKINEVPTLLSKSNLQKLIEDIIEDMKSIDIKKESESLTELTKRIIETMACHHSIRAGMKLEIQEIYNLVKDLIKCRNPYSCPHGRPVIWELTKYQIDKKFDRH